MKNELYLGTFPRDYCQGSLRPLVTEVVLGLPGEVGTLSQSTKAMDLRRAASALDPLWRDCMAALSVGPIEFSRFEGERIQSAIIWNKLMEDVVDDLLRKNNAEIAYVRIPGSTKEERALASVENFEVRE